MAEPPDYFARIANLVDTASLNEKVAVIVGAGSVGSEVARWLAKCSIGRLQLIDGKRLEPHHISRHVNGAKYIGWNKAEALAGELREQLPTLRAEGIDRLIDETVSDSKVDDLIMAADVLVVSTDDRDVQRRVATRALALNIRAVLPGLYENGGGEIFIQRHHNLPCFMCWDGFRPTGESLREVSALGVEASTVERLTVELCLGLLDQDSQYARIRAREDGAEQQLFVLPTESRGYGISRPTIEKRPNCPACGGEPARETAAEVASPAPRAGNSSVATIPSRSINSPHFETIAVPAPQASVPVQAGPLPRLDLESLSGRLILLAICLALAFFAIPLSHALISGLGIEHPSAEHPSLIGALLLIVLALAGGLGCVAGIVGAIGAFFWLLAGLVSGESW